MAAKDNEKKILPTDPSAPTSEATETDAEKTPAGRKTARRDVGRTAHVRKF